jgi:fatty acid desaturase
LPKNRSPRISKSYYRIESWRYFRDFSIDFGAFSVAFLFLLNADTPGQFVVAYIVATVGLHRACVFGHDLIHHYRSPQLKAFRLVWDHTVGAVSLFPLLRFYNPHITHHTAGVFRTADDPQYPLIRGRPAFMIFALGVVPLLLPLWSALQVTGAALGGVRAEAMMERMIDRHGIRTANASRVHHRREIVRRSRVYLCLLVAFGVAVPHGLPLLYAVLAGGWILLALRVPLEHALDSTVAHRTDWHDQMIDSFTIETRLADILQPHGMKYHTAHHLYPAVPYHNLPALHAELKATYPPYRATVISLWQAIKGPTRKPASVTPDLAEI